VLLRDPALELPAVVILHGRSDANRAFVAALDLQIPVIFDEDLRVTEAFNVHTWPFALVYDSRGLLARKGVVDNRAALETMLQEHAVSQTVADDSPISNPPGPRTPVAVLPQNDLSPSP
jgi:hypothetical protein